MQKLVLIKEDKKQKYSTKLYSGNTIYLLEWFLYDQGFSSFTQKDVNFYIDWAKDPSQYHQQSGNVSFLYKENNIISIGFLYSDQEDWGPFFKISVEEFIKLISTWYKLVSQSAQKITITEQDGTISIEGK